MIVHDFLRAPEECVALCYRTHRDDARGRDAYSMAMTFERRDRFIMYAIRSGGPDAGAFADPRHEFGRYFRGIAITPLDESSIIDNDMIEFRWLGVPVLQITTTIIGEAEIQPATALTTAKRNHLLALKTLERSPTVTTGSRRLIMPAREIAWASVRTATSEHIKASDAVDCAELLNRGLAACDDLTPSAATEFKRFGWRVTRLGLEALRQFEVAELVPQ